jgi:hypothetical protein
MRHPPHQFLPQTPVGKILRPHLRDRSTYPGGPDGDEEDSEESNEEILENDIIEKVVSEGDNGLNPS